MFSGRAFTTKPFLLSKGKYTHTHTHTHTIEGIYARPSAADKYSNIPNKLHELSKKVKVKLSLCLTKEHAMKMYWRDGGIAPRILDLGTRWS
jgi:hypothetical protein